MNKRKAGKIIGASIVGVTALAGCIWMGSKLVGFTGGENATKLDTQMAVNALQDKSVISGTKVSTAAKDAITVHFHWTGAQPHISYEIAGTGLKSTYPGIPMKDEGNGWYSCTIANAKKADVVLSIPKVGYETTTFTREAGEYWYDFDAGWSEEAPRDYKETKQTKEQSVKKNEKQVAANTGITIHYAGGIEAKTIYYWNALPKDIETDWPGEEVKKDEDGYYTYQFSDVTKINFLFANSSEQTDDFTIKEAGEYWYKDGKWSKTNPNSSSNPTATPINSARPTSTPTATERTDFRDESIYFIMTSRFYDGDSSNNCASWRDTGTDDNKNNPHNENPVWRGDFKGLRDKLDYIKALGFSAVWITPVVKNASDYDYHGYHAINHAEVDVRLESSDYGYQDLINDAHKKGIKIIQDIVVNHCSDYGEENLFPAYTRTDDISKLDRSDTAMTITDLGKSIGMTDATTTNEGQRCANLKSDTNDPNFIFHHEKNCQWEGYTVQTGQMGAHCVDLNTENPVVCNYLKKAYCNYINMGVDAFRIDTVKHVSRLSFNKEFLPAFQKAGGKNFFMFGEACVLRNEIFNADLPGISVCFYTWKNGDDAYPWKTDETLEATKNNMNLVEKHFTDHSSVADQPTSDNAFLNGNKYHEPDYSEASGMGMIDFYMHHKFGDANSAFGVALEEDKYFNDSTWNVMYVDSHDYGPNEGGSLYTRYNGGTQAWAENLNLIFTFRGIPCVFYGTEVEFMKGVKTDDWYNQLDKTGRAYFGDYLEGSVKTSDYGVYSGGTGKMAETLNAPLAKHMQRLNMLRRKVPALCKGQYSTADVSGSGISYRRRYTANGEDSYVLVNLSGQATFNNIESGTYVELITGKTVQASGSLTTDKVEAGNMRIYVLQNSTAEKYGANGKIGEDGTYLK